MGKENKSYRIRTNINNDSVVNFSINNTTDKLEILSLSINQTNAYKLMGSDTGIVAGRVLANGGFGVPNVKISVFIEYEDTEDIKQNILYQYSSTRDLDNNGVRYNLLPNELDDECHQNIGTFPNKRVLLDNNNWIEVFDKYYSFTTRTNNSGDYMIYGVPTGMQTIHMDVDLSDIGVLSQRPRDLIYKGYNANMFESPNKFKVDTNIDSLAQVITQDQAVYVYPFWGDTTDSELNASITRCDMNINYKFEPTCIFMGSVITDTGENAMSHKCKGAKKQGKMSEMITGEGKIEMIRKTPNGQIEQFSINGDNNINGDGIWCYQIPMNLDYVVHDEFGKMVMSDNPAIGLPTRARVRFRLSMAESPNDAIARKRARFLIPNNPHILADYPEFSATYEVDYEFGTKTKNENFRDLFWNNVYTVKSYIPRLQKSRLPNNLRHLGIKMVNHANGNNPMPFNSLSIKFNFIYTFLCTLVKTLVTIVMGINGVLTFIGYIFYRIGAVFYDISKWVNIKIAGTTPLERVAKLFASYGGSGIDDDDGTSVMSFTQQTNTDLTTGSDVCGGVAAWFMRLFLKIGCGITLKGLCETDDGVEITVSPGTFSSTKTILSQYGIANCNNKVNELYNCVENQLAQENEVTSFNFYNDWINGVVYLPLWYRKIKKRRNGDIKKDIWCSTDNTTVQDRKYKKNLRLYATNVPQRVISAPYGKQMGVISPLINNEDSVKGLAEDTTGLETMLFKKINNDNCYGYQCHKYARTYFKVYKGLVFEKTTTLGDRVYYYKPCDYDTTTGNSDLVTLFATDLVLLGSLNDCDIHGIPQFFKALESTTYNMPPDLMSEYYDYVDEDNQSGLDEEDAEEIDLGSRMTENTGADWGNLGADQSNKRNANENEYDNGGLFYGLTCFNSYTKPKSCINLSRICEFGVSLDESNELPVSSEGGSGTESDTDTLTPDGFISYDEVYNPDYRSMFATLNANFLRTKLNQETGLIEYDFNHMFIDNFDGSLKNLMSANTVNGKTEKSGFLEKANYIGNYNLEQSSDAYLNFRYGNYHKVNGKKIYFYENPNSVGTATQKLSLQLVAPINGRDRLPRYENSFYFYFGLKEGKTAIDKFNTDFFSDCTNKFASDVPYEMTYLGNSWCPTQDSSDGYITFNMNIDTPITIKFTDIDTNYVYECKNINKQKIIFYDENKHPDREGIPEEFENYTKFELTQKSNDSIGGNPEQSTTPIMKDNGTFNIEVIDAYDNSYEDRLIFALPKIGFLCDVSPFSCKNADLMARFTQSTLADTYAAIANYGHNFIPFDIYGRDIAGFIAISDVSEIDYRINLKPFDEDFFGNDYTGVTIDIHDGVATDDGRPGYLGYMEPNGVRTYYLGVPYANQRYTLTLTMLCDKGGGIWEESRNSRTLNVVVYEDEFKVYINDIDYDLIEAFRGGWNDAKLKSNGEFVDSVNEPSNPSVYDVNDIYGWDDVLNVGKYKYIGIARPLKEIDYITTNINEVLAICQVLSTEYTHNGEKDYTIPGTNEKQTPYIWTDEYCYNLDNTYANYYTQGTVQKITYSYDFIYNLYNVGDVIYVDSKYYLEIIVDVHYIRYDGGSIIKGGATYYIYDDVNNEYISQTADRTFTVEEGDEYYYKENIYDYEEHIATDDITVQDANTYYYRVSIYEALDYKSGDVIHVGETYFIKNGNAYLQQIVSDSDINVSESGKYYYRNKIDDNTDIKHGTTYYSDESLAIEAIINTDYLEYTNNETVVVTRVNQNSEYVPLLNNDIYSSPVRVYYINDNRWHTVQHSPSYNDKPIIYLSEHLSGQIGKLSDESKYYSMYFVQGVPYAIAIEDEDGNITMNPTSVGEYGDPNIEYTDLDCMSLVSYRTIINDINEVIRNRGELTRKVAGVFRINDGETVLSLTTKTKALPVKYLICGNSEITTAEELYDYRAGGGVVTIPAYQDFNQLDDTTYNAANNIKIITEGYVVDPSLETSREVFKIPTLTYVSEVEGYTGFFKYVLDDKDKHPYYISVKNKSNSVIPPTDNYSNFDIEGSDGSKNLTITFGVHFYDKPLMGEFPMVLAAFNNLPLYPQIGLGGEGILGWYFNIEQYIYLPSLYEYSNDNEELTANTWVTYAFEPYTYTLYNDSDVISETDGKYYLLSGRTTYIEHSFNDRISAMTVGAYKREKGLDGVDFYKRNNVTPPNGMGVGDFMYQKVIENVFPNNQWNDNETVHPGDIYFAKLSGQARSYTEYTFDFEGNDMSVGDYRNAHSELTGITLYKSDPSIITVGDFKAMLPSNRTYHVYQNDIFVEYDLDSIVYNGYVFYYRDLLVLIPHTNAVIHKVVVEGLDNNGQVLRDYIIQKNILNDRDIDNFIFYQMANASMSSSCKVTRLKFGEEYYYFYSQYNIKVLNNPEYYWCAKIDANDIITYHNDTFDCSTGTGSFFYHNLSQTSTLSELEIIPEDELTEYYTYNNNATILNEYYIYHRGGETPIPPDALRYGLYKIPDINPDWAPIYYGDTISKEEILGTWKPVDLTMPGFIDGYLYNGTPADDEKSNIKATLNEQEIKLDTYVTTPTNDNEDVYTNTRVKRVIYTEYGEDEHPTYGEYVLTENSQKDYQYTEVPLVDEDLVYTDGYGEEYRFPVKGTLNVIFDSPTITYKNITNRVSGDYKEKYEDYIVTQTFYTSDTGYLKHQSLYYIFDCDKTQYPLFYSSTDSGSSIDSNLKYDENSKKFYFEEFPQLFADIENSDWVSKSKSTNFNLSYYLRSKHSADERKLPIDKFFAIGCCDNTYTISPIMETQKIRVVYNYSGFDVNEYPYVYLLALKDVDNSLYYVEDLYYLNFYRFTFKVADYDDDTGKYNPDVYSQICSIIENTAQKTYIRVNSNSDQYWGSAIKVNISNIGTIALASDNKSKIIKDWYKILIQDKSGVIRVCEQDYIPESGPGILLVTEFEDKESMMDDYNNGGSSGRAGVILYTSTNGEVVTPHIPFSQWTTPPEPPEVYSNTYIGRIGTIERTDGVLITSIPNSAFYDDNSKLKTLILTQNNIGSDAFAHCHNLESVTINDVEGGSVQLGPNLFSGDEALATVKLPSNLETISYGMFQGCWALTRINIPNSVTTIGDCAFYHSGLTSITIPSSVTSIGEGIMTNMGVFQASNLQTVNIEPYDGDLDKKIQNKAFYQCQQLSSITIGNGVTSIGKMAFEYCTSLSAIVIPGSVRTIDERAFLQCHQLRSVVLNEGLQTIGDYAFEFCNNIFFNSITIPNSVTSIGKLAFADDSLRTVTIGTGIESIGDKAFYNSTLTTVYCYSQNPPTIGDWAFGFHNNNLKIYVPQGYGNDYRTASSWTMYSGHIYEML